MVLVCVVFFFDTSNSLCSNIDQGNVNQVFFLVQAFFWLGGVLISSCSLSVYIVLCT